MAEIGKDMRQVRLVERVETADSFYEAGMVLSVDPESFRELIDEGKAIAWNEKAQKLFEEQQGESDEEFIEKARKMVREEFAKDTPHHRPLAVGRPDAQQRLGNSDSYDKALKGKVVGENLNDIKTKEMNDQFLADVKGHGSTEKFSSNGEWLKTVIGAFKGGTVEKDLVEWDDSAGGYLLPDNLQTQILMHILSGSSLFMRIRKLVLAPGKGNTMSFPALAETTRASNNYGGLTMHWASEAHAKTEDQPILRKVELKLNKCAALVPVSDELLQDSPVAVDSWLERLVTACVNGFLEDQIINGPGGGQCLGFLNAGCINTVAAAVPQAAATIVFQNFVDLYASATPECQKTGVFLAGSSPGVLWELMNCGLAVGTGGGPVFISSDSGMTRPIPTTILGRPLLLSPYMAAVGTVGDIAFVCPEKYLMLAKAPLIAVAKSEHYAFHEDLTYLRFVLRIDGQPELDTTITAQDGATTISDFNVIATRP